MSYTLTIKQMAADDRPREKFMAQGAEALSNSELLAILLGNGTLGESALDLTRRILSDCDNRIGTLQRLSLEQLCMYKGVGPAKAVTIKAAAELARRRLLEDSGDRPVLNSGRDIRNYFAPRIGHLSHEEVHAVYLNNNHRVVGHELIGRGGLNGTLADIRLVMRGALLANATVVALCHNHPSGNVRPSHNDDTLTSSTGEACRTMNLKLLDHVIVADGEGYYSYYEEGKL